jgi:hypothetical protein
MALDKSKKKGVVKYIGTESDIMAEKAAGALEAGAYYETSDLASKKIYYAVSSTEFKSETAGGDKNVVINQNTPSAVWVLTHNLGKIPSVTIFTSAHDVVIGGVSTIDNNTTRLEFSAPFSGYAVFN